MSIIRKMDEKTAVYSDNELLLIHTNEWTPDALNVDGTQNILGERSQQQRVHPAWFHFYELLEHKASLRGWYTSKQCLPLQSGNWLKGSIRETFASFLDGNVLEFDWDGSYVGIHQIVYVRTAFPCGTAITFKMKSSRTHVSLPSAPSTTPATGSSLFFLEFTQRRSSSVT